MHSTAKTESTLRITRRFGVQSKKKTSFNQIENLTPQPAKKSGFSFLELRNGFTNFFSKIRRRFGYQSEQSYLINDVKNFISTITTRITKKPDNPLLDSSLSGIFLSALILGAYFASK